MRSESLCGFGSHFPMVKDAQYPFLSLLSVRICSAVKCLPVSLACFQIGSFGFYCCVLIVMFIIYIQVFVRCVVCKYFLRDWSLCLYLLNMIFLRTKVSMLMKSSLSIFPCMDCGFGVESKNSLHSPRS